MSFKDNKQQNKTYTIGGESLQKRNKKKNKKKQSLKLEKIHGKNQEKKK